MQITTEFDPGDPVMLPSGKSGEITSINIYSGGVQYCVHDEHGFMSVHTEGKLRAPEPKDAALLCFNPATRKIGGIILRTVSNRPLPCLVLSVDHVSVLVVVDGLKVLAPRGTVLRPDGTLV